MELGSYGMNLRPVELAELDNSELDIASLVLTEGLAQFSSTLRNLLERRVLELGDIRGTHCFGNGTRFELSKSLGLNWRSCWLPTSSDAGADRMGAGDLRRT